MTSRAYFAGLALLTAVSAQNSAYAAEPAADTVYRNGYVYTVDAKDSVQEALAVRAGRIVYVGDNACLLYTSPSPRDQRGSRMPSSA